jgi:2-keto-4-pentenoate hydratase/2-oxohepta-3-ene-1,7-dioic acid hydratase in catechol pathway
MVKLCLFDGQRLGAVLNEEVADLEQFVGRKLPNNILKMRELISRYEELKGDIVEGVAKGKRALRSSVKLSAPIPEPSKILCAFANYKLHAQEMGGTPVPPKPELFLKAPSAVIGPGDKVVLPNVPAKVFHHEAELAVVIGKLARNVEASQALKHVFGYTCFIDVSARGLPDNPFCGMLRGKSFDTFAPVGPYIVTADEIPNPQDLQIKLWVNGELRQNGNTRDMVYGVPEQIEYCSSIMTLKPGDIIATGTPEGVGPIKDGDKIKMWIERIGELEVIVSS